MNQRVVITGMGVITPIGTQIEEFWHNLLDGVSGIRPVAFPGFDMQHFRTRIAGTLPDFDLAEFMPVNKKTRYLGRATRVCLAAAKMALENAGLELIFDKTRATIPNLDPYKIGVIVGSGSGNMDVLDSAYPTFLEQMGPRKMSSHVLPYQLISTVAASLAMHFNCRGMSYVIPASCSSAAHAIGNSYWRLKNGAEDIIVSGGVECAVTPPIFSAFIATRAMSTRNDEPEKASRPFDRERDGFVMGEGAGIVVLEKLEHALSRKAPIFAEIIGVGVTSDAHHVTIPALDGKPFIRAIEMALQEAGIKPDDIDYINAHGTSTPLNDPIETHAIKEAFGKRAYEVPINSTKSMTGHLIGAAGGIETIVAVLSIRDDMVHPTINYEFPDPRCDLDYVPNQKRSVPVNIAMTNSLGFGGFNSSLILRGYDE
jgi:beta-ketoacyl-acyl-carrier-protein synthase II